MSYKDKVEEREYARAWRRENPEYFIWANMIQRCYNPKNCSYKNYGARGISVCDLWRWSYAAFLADMGRRCRRRGRALLRRHSTAGLHGRRAGVH